MIRCCCRRCTGHVYWTNAAEFLEAHQLGPNEYVLDCEIRLLVDHGKGPSLFDVMMEDDW